MMQLVDDTKKFSLWRYRKYTDEEVNSLTAWMGSPAVNKEIVYTDNLWDNMKKLSQRVGVFTHPVFENTEYYIKIANRDVTDIKDRAS